MPDTKVSITISGLAICRYREEKLFELVFLDAERHELDLYVTKRKYGKSITGAYKIPSSTAMSVTAANAKSVHPALENPDKNYNQIVHIDKINGEVIPLKEKPMVKLTYLSVQEPICYTAKMSNREYDFWRVRDDMREKIAGPVRIGLDIGIDFIVAESGQVRLTLDKPNGVPLIFPHEDGVEYDIKFDNVCAENPDINDFDYYFDVFTDKYGRIEQLFAVPPGGMMSRSLEVSCNPVEDGDCDLWLYYAAGRCHN